MHNVKVSNATQLHWMRSFVVAPFLFHVGLLNPLNVDIKWFWDNQVVRELNEVHTEKSHIFLFERKNKKGKLLKWRETTPKKKSINFLDSSSLLYFIVLLNVSNSTYICFGCREQEREGGKISEDMKPLESYPLTHTQSGIALSKSQVIQVIFSLSCETNLQLNSNLKSLNVKPMLKDDEVKEEREGKKNRFQNGTEQNRREENRTETRIYT